MKKIFALVVLIIGNHTLIAGGQNHYQILNWKLLGVLAAALDMLPPEQRHEQIMKIVAAKQPYEAIVMQVIFSEEFVAKIRSEFDKNPNKNIKIEVGDSDATAEWDPEEVRAFLFASESLRVHAPDLLEEMGRHGMQRLGIPYEEGRREFRRHADIKVNGHSVFTRSHTGTYILLGIGALAVVYGIYNYFTQDKENESQEITEGNLNERSGRDVLMKA